MAPRRRNVPNRPTQWDRVHFTVCPHPDQEEQVKDFMKAYVRKLKAEYTKPRGTRGLFGFKIFEPSDVTINVQAPKKYRHVAAQNEWVLIQLWKVDPRNAHTRHDVAWELNKFALENKNKYGLGEKAAGENVAHVEGRYLKEVFAEGTNRSVYL